MRTTSKRYIEQKQSELFKSLGCFFAFNTQQFKEGLEEAGGIEKTGKYANMGMGLCCPTKNIDALIKGIADIKKQWHEDRKKAETIPLKFVGIDNWNRPVWKAPDIKAYFGSVNELFDYEATEEEVRAKVDIYDLCYFGTFFGCEPMGTDVPDKYYLPPLTEIPTQLPIYTYGETVCSIDFKLEELRPVDAPYNVISFTELNDETKADLRAIRAEFYGVCYIKSLDD